jgi:TatD DNase family protein
MLIDTHCHLTHDRYAEDRPGILGRAAEAGVGGIVCVASNLDDARAVEDLVREVEAGSAAVRIWRTAGVHPHEAAKAPEDLRPRLLEILDGSEHPAAAVGECGLDFHYDFSPRARQREVFRVHLEVAAETGLPLVVHCREAEEEMAGFVTEAGRAGVAGVLHCFPGDLVLLEAAMEAGWLVSFTGLVTFGSFDGLEAVRRVPGDRYMLETDGPYMAPVPHRGKRNEPAWVPFIRDRVAQLRGEEPAQVESATTATAFRFFRLEEA